MTTDLYEAGHTAFKFQGVSEDGQHIEYVRQRDLENPPDPFERMKPETLRKCLRRIRERDSRDT